MRLPIELIKILYNFNSILYKIFNFYFLAHIRIVELYFF